MVLICCVVQRVEAEQGHTTTTAMISGSESDCGGLGRSCTRKDKTVSEHQTVPTELAAADEPTIVHCVLMK